MSIFQTLLIAVCECCNRKVKVNAIKITEKHFLRNHNLSISNFCKNFMSCHLESIKVELKKNFSLKKTL